MDTGKIREKQQIFFNGGLEGINVNANGEGGAAPEAIELEQTENAELAEGNSLNREKKKRGKNQLNRGKIKKEKEIKGKGF